MEFVFYFVLILALVSVAGFMLYVRFTAGRDKALHHSPLSIASGEDETVIPADENSEPVFNEMELEDSIQNDLPAIRAEAKEAENTDDERKSEYLDELQEAAAGLAMLMRSSASNRTTPVVFAPEEAEPSAEAEVVEVTATEETVEAEAEEVVMEAPAEVVPEPEKKTLTMLLGADVAEQFGKIDSDLDALEALVVNIESGLSVLAPLNENETADNEFGEVELTEAA